MGLIESVTESGLVLLENREDGSAVAQALRRYDPDLSLRANLIPGFRDPLWRVYRKVGSEHRDAFVTAWQDAEGKPLPLSMRLLEKIKELDRNTRSETPDAEYLNELARKRIARQAEADREAIWDEHRPILKGKREVSMVVSSEHKERL